LSIWCLASSRRRRRFSKTEDLDILSYP
jgi:hypothetical protein